jgi:ATP-dependent Clp protease ATP-binding subunit ClpX
MEKTMMDVMYDIPSDDTIVSCVITKDAVEGTAPPRIEHGEKAPLPEKKTSNSAEKTTKPRRKRKAAHS